MSEKIWEEEALKRAVDKILDDFAAGKPEPTCEDPNCEHCRSRRAASDTYPE